MTYFSNGGEFLATKLALTGCSTMICDGLSEEEIYHALLIYTSLHGLCNEEWKLRKQVADFERCLPDEMVDNAIMAYMEDKVVAPPDVVLARWGASRVYELDTSQANCVKHMVCESWFEHGCRFELDFRNAPMLAHFWADLNPREQSAIPGRVLEAGTRLRFETGTNRGLKIMHREYGHVGNVASQLAALLNSSALQGRKFLPLVDRHEEQGGPSKILVTTAVERVSVVDIVTYSAAAFHAVRTKC